MMMMMMMMMMMIMMMMIYLFDGKIMHYYFKQKPDETIKHQKVEDIKMPKSSKNESDKMKELGLTMEELKSIARKIAVKS